MGLSRDIGRWALAGACLLGPVCGCSGQVTAKASLDAGSSSFVAGQEDGGAGGPALAVQATASPPSICPGQCVDLEAQASGGVAPYSFAWSDGAGGTSSTHVCPASTTTYTVVARDASGTSGELARPAAQGSASVSVNVDAACAASADAGDAAVESSEAGASADSGPAPALSEGCYIEWNQPAGLWVGDMQLATDPSGGFYVAFTYYFTYSSAPTDPSQYPKPNLGTPAPSPSYTVGLALARLDGSCHLQWAREFGSSSPATAEGVVLTAIATDAASEVTLLGTFQGSVDLGAGMVAPVSAAASAGYLLRVDATGKTVFSSLFQTHAATGLMPFDLAVSPAGVSTVSLRAPPDTDFGNGPDIASVLSGYGPREYLVRFDAHGANTARIGDSTLGGSVDEVINLASNAAGDLWSYGYSGANTANAQGLVIGLTPSLGFSWSQPMSANDIHLAAGGGSAIVLEPGYTANASEQTLTAYTAGGQVSWSTLQPVTYDSGGGHWVYRLTVGPSGRPYAAGTFKGTIRAAPGSLTSYGGQDLHIEAFDGAGHLVAQRRWGAADDELVGGLGVDASGRVFVAGSTVPLSSPASTSRVFAVRFDP
jgi:hypothetical protein